MARAPAPVLQRGAARRHGQIQPAACVNALPTCAHRLKALTGCGDPVRLKSAVHELCAEFGKVTNIEILTMTEADQRRALCFLRLESEAQEMQLMASLGVGRFGNDVLVIVDLPLAT